LPPPKSDSFAHNSATTSSEFASETRQKFRKKLREGALDDKEIEVDVGVRTPNLESNGARCFAQFVKRQGLIERDKMRVETLAGVYAIEIIDHTLVKVDMGQPEFDPAKIPFMPAQQDTHQIQIKQQQINFQVVSIGNPHAVIFVDDVDAVALGDIGSQLEVDPRFPQRTNVQFVQIVDSETIKQRIFERGAGETMASGSGACAAVAVGQKYKNLAAHVVVNMPGGKLSINADPISHTLYMTGPTEISFEGSIHL
jgi:diaminopimelate epimerase